jgi:hypothetical protein
MQRQRRVAAEVLGRAHQGHIGLERKAAVGVFEIGRAQAGPGHQRRAICAALNSECDQAGSDPG